MKQRMVRAATVTLCIWLSSLGCTSVLADDAVDSLIRNTDDGLNMIREKLQQIDANAQYEFEMRMRQAKQEAIAREAREQEAQQAYQAKLQAVKQTVQAYEAQYASQTGQRPPWDEQTFQAIMATLPPVYRDQYLVAYELGQLTHDPNFESWNARETQKVQDLHNRALLIESMDADEELQQLRHDNLERAINHERAVREGELLRKSMENPYQQ